MINLVFSHIPHAAPLWLEMEEQARLQQVVQFKAALCRLICALDSCISEQLSQVIQAPSFKQLESSWMGLQSLTQLPVSQRRVKVKVLDLSWNQVSSDLNLSFDIKQTALFKNSMPMNSIPQAAHLLAWWWSITKFIPITPKSVTMTIFTPCNCSRS